ncbi:hypothetical protein [Alkalicoccobacillus porphyridii]|uniref:Uncharacterized protein n=1 Tax=Alkalicoccobacillus porphyridii TaxID=2597270 RepID=A0A553ZZ23_9BACI|nr:hypothetical protein [Alkalicoccobacillus porphyridii]TSB46699.1 hypothetical protein FN960_10110 [Alkalicoccobacillus porphyridii]
MKFFGNHFIVFLLPAILMLTMAIGGYFYLIDEESNESTNATLQENIDWDANERGTLIEVAWEWPSMPTDGMFGDDYIGVKGPIENVYLELHASDGVLYEADGEQVDNGWIVSFPNRLEENRSLGNRGSVYIELTSSEYSAEDLDLFLLHTWSEHSPLELEDASFEDPSFGEALSVPHWVEEIEVASYVR